ncbi:unnamed protein product [Nezara viridula]|uniref:Uncharacterized protein n=1 Tax=Nezara viridula TaxID=85310 RepID=A0A9P0E5C3_NEZVI|nr:unnamed protein product [Nezara viridula]
MARFLVLEHWTMKRKTYVLKIMLMKIALQLLRMKMKTCMVKLMLRKIALEDSRMKLKTDVLKMMLMKTIKAIEDEDGEIYVKNDTSRDEVSSKACASLKETRRKESQKEKEMLVVTENFNGMEGRIPAKIQSYRRKYYPPCELQHNLDPNIPQRKLGFSPEVVESVQAVKGEDLVNSSERAIILGESLPDHRKEVETDLNEETQTEEDKSSDELSFRPFIGDHAKQVRYKRYLGFIKIEANDTLKIIHSRKLPQRIRKEKNDKTDGIKIQNINDIQNSSGADTAAPELMYGPSLPTKPIFIEKSAINEDSESSSSETEWTKKGISKKKKHSKKRRKRKKEF